MADQPSIVITDRPLPRPELSRLVNASFGTMVKFVVDVRREAIAIGGELHADAEALLLEAGSAQDDLWGANYYPGRGSADCIEFTALINIRPATGNRGMEVADAGIRDRIRDIAFRLIGAGEKL